MQLTGRILWLTDDPKQLEQQLAGADPSFDASAPMLLSCISAMWRAAPAVS